MSKAKPWRMPSRCWISTAVAGKVWFGVDVASTMRSMSAGRQAGIVERGARRRLAERGGGLVVAGDMALADAGALRDPLVGGLDDALEVGVLHDAAAAARTRYRARLI